MITSDDDHDDGHDKNRIDHVRQSVLFGHRHISGAYLPTNSRCCSKLNAQWYHVEQPNDVDNGNLSCELVLAEHASEDGQQLEGPPLGALHHGPGHAQLQKFLGSLPVKRVRVEQRLHVVLKEAPSHYVDVHFLSQEVGAVGDVQSEGGPSDSHVPLHDDQVAPSDVQQSSDALGRRWHNRLVNRLQKALRAVKLD